MKTNLIFSLVFFAFAIGPLKSQIVTKTDTIGTTPLTISMDKRISDTMAKLEENCEEKNKINRTESDSGVSESRNSTSSRPLTRAEICRQNPKILGYKIQIAVVNSNQEANEVRSFFRRRFPNIKVETDASLRPNYRILVGSYVSTKSASSDLRRIREHFKSARAVQYRVFCEEAK